MLSPSVEQMLYVGEGCGLNTLSEAIQNYDNHYDMFFSIEKIGEQYAEFFRELKSYRMIYPAVDPVVGWHVAPVTIQEALEMIRERNGRE